MISSGIQNVSVASAGLTANPTTSKTLNLVPGDATSPKFKFSWQSLNGGTDGASVSLATDAISGAGSFSFYASSVNSLNNFAAGQTVGPDNTSGYPKYASSAAAAFYAANGDWTPSLGGENSNWSAGGSGYAGFNFVDANSQTHYGWMELIVPTTSIAGQEATLVQWAWESVADAPITTPVPEIDPASAGSALALLVGGLALVEQQLGFAAGAAGLRAWRKRTENGDGSDFSG